MNLLGTHINYYRICKRKPWLFANNISMEQTSDLVSDGKVIEEESYQRRSDKYTQIELYAEYNGVRLTGKIDFFNTRDKVVHETKRSNKVEVAHIWQVKFYLWLLKLNGIDAIGGIIEYPRLRERENVMLTKDDEKYLEESVASILRLVSSDVCPPVIKAKICKNCSYYDFCYVDED